MKIYAAKLFDEVYQDEILKLLDKDRQRRVSYIKNEEERKRSIVAGLLLRYAFLQSGYSLEMWENIKIETEEYGKPYIKGYSEFNYSLSHSGEWIICAVDKSAVVGADIQKMLPWKINIAKRFYDENEYNRLLALEESDKDKQTKEFYSMWSAKESVVKLSGRGIGAGINRYVTNDDYSCIYDMDKDKGIGIKLYDELDGYIICVCSESDDFPEKLELVNIAYKIHMEDK